MDCSEKKKLLVVFLHDHIGGAMTALVNFVNALDTDRYDVDLLLYQYSGKSLGIKPEIHVLMQADGERHYLSKVLSPAYMLNFVQSQYLAYVQHNVLLSRQLRSQQGCRYSRRLEKEYDAAIAFELNWPFYYTMNFVHAKKKLVWIHNDYQAIGYCFRWDEPYFDQVDGMVFVSQECMDEFSALHPKYRNKCFFMPNINSRDRILCRAKEPHEELPFTMQHPGLSLVTVARMEFSTKGLDRIPPLLDRLRSEGLLDGVHWLIIGDGDDLPAFQKLVGEYHLEDVVFPIGMRENALPYLPGFDAFLLPSRNEGRPVSVTEAQVLGVVPVVAHYIAATGQIENGVDGFIFENDDEALYCGLRDLILHPEKLRSARQVLSARTYTNEADIVHFYHILDSL